MTPEMKNLFLFAFIIFSTTFAKAQWQAGGGLIFGTEIENLGLQLKGVYSLDEQVEDSKFDVAGEFSYFFPDNTTVDFGNFGSIENKVTLWALNFNAHYDLLEEENLILYPLAGLNIASITAKSENSQGEDFSDTDTELGLNLGIGAKTMLTDNLAGYGEIKYVISDFDQAVFSAGVLYSFP